MQLRGLQCKHSKLKYRKLSDPLISPKISWFDFGFGSPRSQLTGDTPRLRAWQAGFWWWCWRSRSSDDDDVPLDLCNSLGVKSRWCPSSLCIDGNPHRHHHHRLRSYFYLILWMEEGRFEAFGSLWPLSEAMRGWFGCKWEHAWFLLREN